MASCAAVKSTSLVQCLEITGLLRLHSRKHSIMYRIIVICHKLSFGQEIQDLRVLHTKFFLLKHGKDMLSFLFLAGGFWVYSWQILKESIKGK